MPALATGKLRHRVQLQDRIETVDATTGERFVSWITTAEIWGEIVPMSAREFIAAQAEQSEVRGRIMIRYREGVNATQRIVYRDEYYDIHGVMRDAESGREHLTLMVGEGVRFEDPASVETFYLLTSTYDLLTTQTDQPLTTA